jgi:nucleotide-binding universal stress UspA family protein
MEAIARKLLLGCLLMAAAVPCARLEASTPVGPPLALTSGPRLEWSDPAGLVPLKMLDLLTEELTAMARAMGVDMGLAATGAADETGPHRYRVSVMQTPKAHWRLRQDVMAAAPRAAGHQGTIYIFLEQVRRVLGHLANHDSSETAREHAELARALARILAHEVVHVVAPDHPHATSGLMVARLRRGPLTKRKARIDQACARAFRDALAAP